MLACGNVNPCSVRLLLSHGADPNANDGIQVRSWPLDRNDPTTVMSTSVYPIFFSGRTPGPGTRNADKVVALLLSAGLRSTAGNWLQTTSVGVYMSRNGGQDLRNIVFHVPTLSEISILECRQQIRKLMVGKMNAGFNQCLKSLPLPVRIKQQLKINL